MKNDIAKTTTRLLRKNQTPEEIKIWEQLKNRRFNNLKFLRQHPVKFQYENKHHFYICDFYCAEYKLVIEIDGEIHKDRIEQDELRDSILEKMGVKVVRFWNDEVNENVGKVMVRIKRLL